MTMFFFFLLLLFCEGGCSALDKFHRSSSLRLRVCMVLVQMYLCLCRFVSEKSVCVCVWVECPGLQKGHLPACGLGSTALGAFVFMKLHETSSAIVATPCIWSTFPRHCVNQLSTAGDVSRHEHRLRAQKVSSPVSYKHGLSCTDVFFLTGFD